MHLTFDAELYTPLRHDDRFNREQEKTWAKVLDLLDTHGVTITNFVTWEFAQTFPDLLKRMVEAGHEIASHSLDHQYYHVLGQQRFEDQVRESKRRLERTTGKPVIGFRAPYGQVPSDLARTLVRHGYSYDSSLAATYIPQRFSGLFTPRRIYRPSVDNIRREEERALLWEIPVSVSPWLPVPFGGFFLSILSPFVRVLPGIRGEPNVMFFHPYDFVDLSRFPGSYPWDRHKFTRSNWRLLEYFAKRMAGNDTSLRQVLESIGGAKTTTDSSGVLRPPRESTS